MSPKGQTSSSSQPEPRSRSKVIPWEGYREHILSLPAEQVPPIHEKYPPQYPHVVYVDGKRTIYYPNIHREE